MAIQIIFWVSLLVVLYTYMGHPLLLYIIARITPKRWTRGDANLSTAIYVSAFNEEEAIADKINNLLEQDYTGDYSIIIANDGSTDRTAEIVNSFKDPRIKLFDFKENRGKAAMQNEIIPVLDSDIVIFSDTTSMWKKHTLRKIVHDFKDLEVGCVSVDILFVRQIDGGVEKGQGAYWRYERFLRKYGSLVKTNIVASGTTYAIRRKLFTGLPLDIGEDLSNPLTVAASGKRVIFDTDIVIEEKSSTSHDVEFKMRSRIATRNVTGMFKYWRFLNPRHGMATYQLLMHKYLRVFCWIPLITALFANIALYDRTPYYYILPFHIGFYGMAFAGYLIEKRNMKMNIFYLPYYFTLLNFACTIGFINYSRGVRRATWNPQR